MAQPEFARNGIAAKTNPSSHWCSPSNLVALSGVDSLYSIVQMPGGVPVATMAIGEAGATNAALFALRLLSVEDQAIATALADFAEEQGKIAEESTNELI